MWTGYTQTLDVIERDLGIHGHGHRREPCALSPAETEGWLCSCCLWYLMIGTEAELCPRSHGSQVKSSNRHTNKTHKLCYPLLSDMPDIKKMLSVRYGVRSTGGHKEMTFLKDSFKALVDDKSLACQEPVYSSGFPVEEMAVGNLHSGNHFYVFHEFSCPPTSIYYYTHRQ